MHLGNYLKETSIKQRFSVAKLADVLAKSETAVRNDFEKETLHMGVIEGYAKAFGINIYEILGKVWMGYPEDEIDKISVVSEPRAEYKKVKKEDVGPESVSVTFILDAQKKEKLLAMLMA